MKICVLLSSCEDSAGEVVVDGDGGRQEGNDNEDPSFSTQFQNHEFTCKVIKKEIGEAELDEICSRDFDVIWTLLRGSTGVGALKYLESKQVRLIGTTSKFLSLTQLDASSLIASSFDAIICGPGTSGRKTNLNVEGLQKAFPLLLKSRSTHAPLYSRESQSEEENASQSREGASEEEGEKKATFVLEECIVGSDVGVMVLETTAGLTAIQLTPIDSKCSGETHVEGTGADSWGEVVEEIKRLAMRAYEALGVLGSGYAQMDFRLTHANEIYLLEVKPTPSFFGVIGTKGEGERIGGDFGVESKLTVDLDLESLVDTIIAAKERLYRISSTYDKFSMSYDEDLEVMNFKNVMRKFVSEFGFDGSVLDLGCGTGQVGRFIVEKYPNAVLTGIDVSPEMVKIAKLYSQVHVGLIENIIMELNSKFDHLISMGTFPFIDHNNFVKILNRMFKMANVSVSFAVEDVSQAYNESLVQVGYSHMVSFNHTSTLHNFKVPKEWSMIHNKREFMWQSPHTGIKMFGTFYRFERISNDASLSTIGNAVH